MAAPRPREIVCDVGALPADAIAINALARLQLEARRAGMELLLSGASRELGQLLAFCGLSEVLRVETQRQAEEREDGLDLEEERHPGDPAA